MTGILPILIISAAGLFGLFIIGLIVAKMYRKATKETAYVRTGWGGQKVVLNGGALVFPVLHDMIWVNLNTMKLVVDRKDGGALITRDRMRVDVSAEFYLRVKTDVEAIASAAQTLGDRTRKPELLKELMEGKFVDALRSVAAEMDMEELHEKRSDFVQKVQTAVMEDLQKNGLELETVSLTSFDQTDKQFFNADNAFDAQGLTKLADAVETRKKLRNDIVRDNEVAIEAKNLEAKQASLQIKRDDEYATLAQQREVENRKAAEQAQIASVRAEKAKEAQEAQIVAQRDVDVEKEDAARAIEENRIKNAEAVEATEIQKQESVEIANQERNIAVAKKSEEQSQARAEAEKARAVAVREEERVKTAQDTEVAERDKSIAVIKASEQAEQKAVGITVAAEADKKAATDRAEAARMVATGDADAVRIKADADERKYAVDAEGTEAMHEAENKLSGEIIEMRVQMASIEHMSSIIGASVEPIKAIESMRVINVTGMGQVASNGHANGPTTSNGLIDDLLKYRWQSPILDSIVKQSGLADSVDDLIKNPKLLQQLGVKAPTVEPKPVAETDTGKPHAVSTSSVEPKKS